MATQNLSLPALDFTRIGPAVGTPFPAVVLPDQYGRPVISTPRAPDGGRWS